MVNVPSAAKNNGDFFLSKSRLKIFASDSQFSASQPQSDLSSVAYIMYTDINFGYERRRHVGGGNVRIFSQTAGN